MATGNYTGRNQLDRDANGNLVRYFDDVHPDGVSVNDAGSPQQNTLQQASEGLAPETPAAPAALPAAAVPDMPPPMMNGPQPPSSMQALQSPGTTQPYSGGDWIQGGNATQAGPNKLKSALFGLQIPSGMRY